MRLSGLMLLPIVVFSSASAAAEGEEPPAAWDVVSPRYATIRSEPLAPVREVPLSAFWRGAGPDAGAVHIDESGATYRLEAPPHDGDQVVPIMGPDQRRGAAMADEADPVL